jgi:hypothetical protein
MGARHMGNLSGQDCKVANPAVPSLTDSIRSATLLFSLTRQISRLVAELSEVTSRAIVFPRSVSVALVNIGPSLSANTTPL